MSGRSPVDADGGLRVPPPPVAARGFERVAVRPTEAEPPLDSLLETGAMTPLHRGAIEGLYPSISAGIDEPDAAVADNTPTIPVTGPVPLQVVGAIVHHGSPNWGRMSSTSWTTHPS